MYSDYNDSGADDQTGERGVAGITVTAYDATGVAVATTATLADGTYTLNIPTAGEPLRIEFTGLPAGYQTGAAGTGSGTSVQFASAPATNINLGVLKPSEYCQNNPDIVTQCYLFGEQNQSSPTVRVFPYESGTTSRTSNVNVYDPQTPTIGVNDTDVGATWGTAYARTSRQIYTGAFMKRHVGFGPNGPGAIYQINRATGAASLLVDVNAAFAGNPAASATVRI